MDKKILDKKFEDLVTGLYIELRDSCGENPKSRGFIEDEMKKLGDSLAHGYWSCKIGAQRILHKKDNLGRDVLYSPRVLELARDISDYSEN